MHLAGPARILRNVTPQGHWLKLRLLLPAQGNRDAIGAEAVVHAGGKKHWALLQPATSYLASHDPALHFGLGAATTVDAVEILWPDGTKETFPGGPAAQQMVLRQGGGK